MNNKPLVVFRADGDSKMGLGHLIRSSALAAMLKEEFTCVLATRCTIEKLLQQVQSVFSAIISLPEFDPATEVNELVAGIDSDALLVLDGYHFDTDYQKKIVERGVDFFAIDDIHAFPFYARAIINSAGGLSPLDYIARPSTQFYLGPHFALLRPSFLEAAKNRRHAVTNKHCFVCFGGADPCNRTLQILKEELASDVCRFDQFHVVTGSAYQYRQELEQFVSDQPSVIVYSSQTQDEMIAVMKQCSYAICSPSTVAYEYMSLGGVVFLDQIADNQKDVICYFTTEGMAFTLDEINGLTHEQVTTALKKQALFFDGKSGERFRKIFKHHFDGRNLHIRNVKPDDLAICLEWANDAEVRAQSYNQEPISLEQHTKWFQAKLQDRNSFFYILELNHQPVAQIRFQVSGNEAVLGFLVGKIIRGRGMGTAILGKGIEQFLQDVGKPVHIIGHVKKENIASQRSFEKLAFAKTESSTFPHSFTYTMSHGN